MEPSLSSLSTELELRVLEGAQGGARAPLAPGIGSVLAAGNDGRGADIVLRDDPAAAARVRVTPKGAQALLEVLEGQVQLGEQVLATGATVPWAMGAPLRVGASVVAFGPAGDAPWPQDMAAHAEPGRHEPARAASVRRSGAWLVPAGLALTLACGAALGLAHVASAPRVAVEEPVPLAVALKGSEFAALETSRDAGGQMELRGRLSTVAQRTRLDTWLAGRQFAPLVSVQVDEAVARDVTDVFRVNGVAVQAKVQGPGHVVAEASERDAARLARAEETVRRDVRGLERLSVINRAVPLPPPAPPVVEDPGKRIASVVPGDPAYLVTADGARYFVGALLPTGHRITQIAGQRVTLERDGQPSSLNF